MCDKNLGPAIMERDEYIRFSLKEHLLNKNNYTQLDDTIAEQHLMQMKEDTCSLFVEYANKLSKHDTKYFRDFILKLPTQLRIPQYYGMPKVHKQKIPVPLRPVVSQCGSYTAFISTWLDIKLQPFKHYLPSYIKNSQDLLDIIDTLPPLPPNAKIVTTDAVSMYSNIDTTEGKTVIQSYLNTFAHELDKHFPTDLVCHLLSIVMKTNIFKFGSTWWKQINGTAMGTPCACIYATLFFGYHERTLLLQKYKENLLLFKRQIDDIFIIWVPSSPNNIEWENFTKDLNTCSSLDWETENLSNKTHFLDLNLWIDSSTRKIHYSTYQKPMNLFLYIPHHSAHPTNTIKSLIYGLLQTYQRQNPNFNNFRSLAKLLFNRLKVRGHQPQQLREYFRDALTKLQHKTSRPHITHNNIQYSPTSLTPSLTPFSTTFSTNNPFSTTFSTNSSQLSSNPNSTHLFSTNSSQLSPKPNSSQLSSNPNSTHISTNLSQLTTNPNFSQLTAKPNSTQLSSTSTQLSSHSNQLFFHLQYHPKGLSRRNIQQTYTHHCTTHNPSNNNGFNNMINENTGGLLSVKKLTIAYHRPKNLRDILCPTTLLETDTASVNTIASTIT